jgi:hypothetical protein
MDTCPRCGYSEDAPTVLVSDVMARFGVTRQTVFNWMRAGLLPGAFRDPSKGGATAAYLIPKESVEALAANGKGAA